MPFYQEQWPDGGLALAVIRAKWYSQEMERTPAPVTTVEELLKKVEDCSVAEMIALPAEQRARMRRANLHIVDSTSEKEDGKPKG